MVEATNTAAYTCWRLDQALPLDHEGVLLLHGEVRVDLDGIILVFQLQQLLSALLCHQLAIINDICGKQDGITFHKQQFSVLTGRNLTKGNKKRNNSEETTSNSLWHVGQRFPLTANLLKVMSKSVIIWKAAKNMFEKAHIRGSGAVDIRTSRGAVSLLAALLYLQFGGSSFDEITDDLLHPLGVPHVDRRLLELRHLK